MYFLLFLTLNAPTEGSVSQTKSQTSDDEFTNTLEPI